MKTVCPELTEDSTQQALLNADQKLTTRELPKPLQSGLLSPRCTGTGGVLRLLGFSLRGDPLAAGAQASSPEERAPGNRRLLWDIPSPTQEGRRLRT